MNSVYVLLFSCSVVSFGLAKPTAPILGYQDSYGQYSFGYSAPGSARSEIRTLNGETRGVYSYVDDAGFIQTTQYTADSKNGFRVAATNLPQAPLPAQNTQGVILARTEAPQVSEIAQEEYKIGEKNVFLQGLQQLERKSIESNEKEQSQTNIMESEGQSSQNKNAEISVKSAASPITSKIIKQTAIPVFQIPQGNLLIDPYSIQAPINVEGSSKTSASATPKINEQQSVQNNEQINTKELPASMKEQAESEKQDKSTDLPKDAIAPLNILPLSSNYQPTLIKYSAIPTFHYVVYSI
ncbi:uncharacterized protein LOC122576195 [Bombus pyrosoma]|uniref:uncharacterized protein LOC122576195 n=1 Tax=Bombus pyrosoma TaxID=396416 RepID=UPI001CB8ADBB|nr:uncharacterized protein LOC122576195 [Bombus pyrosoma]